MSIRIPLTGVIDYNDAGQTGATSVAGGVALSFQLPQDTDNILVKLTASVIGGGVSAVFQTSDDGGTTYYDVQRSSIVSNANNTTAEWMSIPVISSGVNAFSSVVATGSVVTVNTTIGAAAASTLGIGEVSGMPIIGIQNRVFLRYTPAVTSTDLARVKVLVNQQSATA